MMLIFELVFDCLLNQLLANPKDFMVVLPPNLSLLKYNVRLLGSVLFKLFEDWVVQNVPVDKRSTARPLPRLTFFSLGTRPSPDKQLEPSLRFTGEAREKLDWKSKVYVFADAIPKEHLIDLQNFFVTKDYEILEEIRDTLLERLHNTFYPV